MVFRIKLAAAVLLILLAVVGFSTNGMCFGQSVVDLLSCAQPNCPPVCTATGWATHAALLAGLFLLFFTLSQKVVEKMQ